LISIYGMSGGNQKAFTRYSDKTRGLKGVKWSKERLYKMLGNYFIIKKIQSNYSEWNQLCSSMA